VEFNASDTRSKKLLHEEVSELLSNKSLSGYFQGVLVCSATDHFFHALVILFVISVRNKCKLHYWFRGEVLHISLVLQDNSADDNDDIIIIKVGSFIFHVVLPVLSCYQLLCVCCICFRLVH
jgi:hypothetical protein